MKIKLVRKVLFWYVKVVAKNGKTIFHSETYASKGNALKAARTISKAFKIPFEEDKR